MKLTEADVSKLAAAFGPIFIVLGLMELTGTVADGIAALVGAAAVSRVLTMVVNAHVGPPIKVKWRNIDV
tara:strand:- start:617 stop:826 length:210 start_codon:yes stop_codon:yes gene_type:complete